MAAAKPRPARRGALVLADPHYPEKGPSPAFPRIGETRREAMALARLAGGGAADERRVASERSAHVSIGETDIFLGERATTAALAGGDLARYGLVHVAAHGIIDREPRKTGIALAPSGQDADGILSVADVLDLELDADLVVLSGCDTARGPIRRGEGVQSLARAFLYAGARSVVAGLWAVGDEAAAETMEAFHERRLRGGDSTARALREAKLESIRRGRHPRDRAPFIAIGADAD